MSSALKPLQSAKFIARFAKNVQIDEISVKSISEWIRQRMTDTQYDIRAWKQHTLHPKVADRTAIDWIFLVDTLNFSFWSGDDNHWYSVTFDGQTYSGYWSLCAAVNRAIREGVPITEPAFYSKITADQLRRILRADTENAEIPLFEQRLQILQQTGNLLVQKFGGSFVNCVLEAKNSAENLLEIIVENFESFRDEAVYENKKVSFYKRAQIVIADIWACFEDKDLGHFKDIDCLTMFADYRVPQVLAYFGVLKYSDALLSRLNANEILQNGDSDEVEIRGLSILAVDMICKRLQESGAKMKVNAVIVDYYLWDYRRECSQQLECVPFHKVRSVFY